MATISERLRVYSNDPPPMPDGNDVKWSPGELMMLRTVLIDMCAKMGQAADLLEEAERVLADCEDLMTDAVEGPDVDTLHAVSALLTRIREEQQ